MNTRAKPINLFLIEDNDADVFLAKKAFSTLKTPHTIYVSMDGEEALNKLKSCGVDGDMPIPDFIFMDLNLPKMDGAQILAEIKKIATLTTIPVIALSSSKSDQDVRRIYGLHANAYLVKPQSLDDFRNMVAVVESFWFQYALVPQN